MAFHLFHPNSGVQPSSYSRNVSFSRAAGDLAPNKEKALLELMDRTGYPVVQENGQRKYGPPPNWTAPPPQKGCEVFIGKIPRDCYEDELIPIFEKIGKIYELRLMMDFSGSNRGYAFLMYTNFEDAKNAIATLNNYEIRPKKFIGVVKSIDNCRLFVGGIPKNKTKEDIIDEMRKITNGVVNAIVYSSVNEKSRNRGFAFVEYNTHRDAAMARRKLLPGKIQLWGHDIAVDWADPLPEVDEEIMSKVTVLYVRNLNQNVREEQIREIFSLGVMNLKIDKVKKMRDFAFVHYSSRQEAEQALDVLSKMNFSHLSSDGQQLEVTWAKPPNSGKDRKKRNKKTPGMDHVWNGFRMDHLIGSQTPVLSPSIGVLFGPISQPHPQFHPQPYPEYSNSLINNRTSPYVASSLNNFSDFLSPPSQLLFRGVPLPGGR